MMLKALAICCLVAFVTADVSELSNEYLPPVHDSGFGGGAVGGAVGGGAGFHSGGGGGAIGGGGFHSGGGAIGGGGGGFAPSQEYLAPHEAEPAHSFSDDQGYRYKTAKRRVFRNRRVFRQRRRY